MRRAFRAAFPRVLGRPEPRRKPPTAGRRALGASGNGWSVAVTGTAARVTDAQELARYQKQLTPWIDARMEQVVRIRPEIVSGYRLVRAGSSGPPQ
ncbi:pyridoxamine 5'-phosphate oxidase family protein [Streptomyces sp. NPDC059679]|uniref:pyridoxamine 5'-phosphate oxidase family protein n=1 Tax=Streptomyces sp. NPDC059679 TaxID=3346903 RepID=UPI0036C3E301